MTITTLFANLACTDLAQSEVWFAQVFSRRADAHPMPGLAEWRVPGSGLQLVEDPAKAGQGTLTLIVPDLDAERTRLAALHPGAVEDVTVGRLVRLADPDGNLVVLVGQTQNRGSGAAP